MQLSSSARYDSPEACAFARQLDDIIGAFHRAGNFRPAAYIRLINKLDKPIFGDSLKQPAAGPDLMKVALEKLTAEPINLGKFFGKGLQSQPAYNEICGFLVQVWQGAGRPEPRGF